MKPIETELYKLAGVIDEDGDKVLEIVCSSLLAIAVACLAILIVW